MDNNKIKLFAATALAIFAMCLSAAAQAGGVDDPCRQQYLGNGGRCQTVGSGGRMSVEDQFMGSGGRQDAGQVLGSGAVTGQILGSGGVTGGQTAEDGGYLGSGNRSGMIGSGTATGGGPSTEDCGGLIGSGTFTGCRNSGQSLSVWDWLRSLFE